MVLYSGGEEEYLRLRCGGLYLGALIFGVVYNWNFTVYISFSN